MHGVALHSFLAEIAIPDAWQCFAVAAPVIAVIGLWTLIRNIDLIIHRLFPHWHWETRLSWLNIKAYQRADAILRWMGYAVYAVLAVTLYGIVWGAQVVSRLHQLDDPKIMAEAARRLPVLLISVGIWLVYLGFALIPKLKREYEDEELEKFRAEMKEAEQEAPRPSRFPTGQPGYKANYPSQPGRKKLGR